MKLFLTSCILVFFGICSGNVTESSLSDVTESTLLDVTKSALPDVTESTLLNVTALPDVTEIVLFDVTESVLPNVTETALFNVTESVLPNVTETALFNVTETALLDDTDPPPVEKKNNLSCRAYRVGPAFYELLPNSSVLLIRTNDLIDEKFYSIVNETLYFCIPPKPNTTETTQQHMGIISKITVANLALSMIGLFLHLVVFCLVTELRNLPGCNLAALCACLFASYALMLLRSSDPLKAYYISCIALAYTTHFFLLSSFLWMSIMSSSVFVSLLQATRGFRSSGTQFGKRKFGLFCLCAFGVALLFNIFAVLVDTLEDVPDHWRPKFGKSCWFQERMPLLIFFAGPVILLSCLNFVLFAATACVIHVNKRKCDQDAEKSALPTRYMMYFRLSAIMGVTWISGVLANAVNREWMWLIFILLNTLQGFFIFLGFTCSKKVKKYFREKILGARRSSEQSLTPTFQSYCVYSTDADNTVESSK